MYSRRNFYKCQAMVRKFGVNDRCGNLTKKTELSWLRASPGGNSGNFLIKMVQLVVNTKLLYCLTKHMCKTESLFGK